MASSRLELAPVRFRVFPLLFPSYTSIDFMRWPSWPAFVMGVRAGCHAAHRARQAVSALRVSIPDATSSACSWRLSVINTRCECHEIGLHALADGQRGIR